MTEGSGIARQCLNNEYCDIPSYNLNFDGNVRRFIMDQIIMALGKNVICTILVSIFGVKCVGGICSGLSLNESCRTSKQCNPGMDCQSFGGLSNKKICSYLIKAGKICDPELDKCEYR